MSVMTDARNSPPSPWSRSELPEAGIGDLSEITVALRDLDQYSRAFERRLGTVLSVNPTDLSAMQHLIQEGPLTPSELATRLGVTTAASTLVVDRLVALGHVERHRHERDRRKIVVVPARASVNHAIDELLPVITGVARLVDDMSAADRQVVATFLAGVVEVYRAAAETPLD
jgi:DNA-binding MarR family transcriptional regulator